MFRKLTVGGIIVIFSSLLFAGPSMADYKPKLAQDVTKILQDFFRQEQGNRLTVYSMEALMSRINRSFGENIVVPQVPDKPKEKKDIEDVIR
ncbi:hypothetical protein DRH29_05750, partial [candidate division Kazan bacterium]